LVEAVERLRIEGIFDNGIDHIVQRLVEALRRLSWSFPAYSTCSQEVAVLLTVDRTSITTWELVELTRSDVGRKEQKKNVHGDGARTA
jgi:hypothetical protein